MMPNKSVCTRCMAIFDGPGHNVPGKSFGATVIDQRVCGTCHARHHAKMDEFWRGANQLGGNACSKCGTELTRQNSKPVSRRANNGGADVTDVICDSCHAEYRKYCAEASAQK